jgi:nicotinate phosphoribosyltransferase
VTCQAQPALGCVYKLVEADGSPCIKVSGLYCCLHARVNDLAWLQLSADVQKVTMPGKKLAFRLYGQDDAPICDILTQEKGDIVPKVAP